jgi:hypothetical protein
MRKAVLFLICGLALTSCATSPSLGPKDVQQIDQYAWRYLNLTIWIKSVEAEVRTQPLPKARQISVTLGIKNIGTQTLHVKADGRLYPRKGPWERSINLDMQLTGDMTPGMSYPLNPGKERDFVLESDLLFADKSQEPWDVNVELWVENKNFPPGDPNWIQLGKIKIVNLYARD